MSGDVLQLAIYRIDTTHELFAESSDYLESLTQTVETSGYTRQQCRSGISEQFAFVLLYSQRPQQPKWKSFFATIAVSGENILRENQTWSESFILLLRNGSSNELYAITGGLGHFAIRDYVDEEFGIDVLSRLIRKDDKSLRAISEVSVLGGVFAARKFFRNHYNLLENDGFGKIYQELTANLDPQVLVQRFGFEAMELRNSVCIAKNSFRITRSITFQQLLSIINGCHTILTDASVNPTAINSVRKLDKRRQTETIDRLRDELFAQLWNRYQDRSSRIDFDLCHKEFDKYLTAVKYKVMGARALARPLDDQEFDALTNVDELFDRFSTLAIYLTNLEVFRKFLLDLFVVSCDEEGIIQTKGRLLHHLFGDVSLDGRKYFFVENAWYQIDEHFLLELNETCTAIMRDNLVESLTFGWAYGVDGEDAYNARFIGQPNTLVLHKVLVDRIELADIVKWTDDTVYFYHIKAGFDNAMRDLTAQVLISARKLQASSAQGLGILAAALYNQLANLRASSDPYFSRVARQIVDVTKEEFVTAFTKPRIALVLAVMDTANNQRLLSEVDRFGSSIAKFALQELVKSIRGLGMELQFCQIEKISIDESTYS